MGNNVAARLDGLPLCTLKEQDRAFQKWKGRVCERCESIPRMGQAVLLWVMPHDMAACAKP